MEKGNFLSFLAAVGLSSSSPGVRVSAVNPVWSLELELIEHYAVNWGDKWENKTRHEAIVISWVTAILGET